MTERGRAGATTWRRAFWVAVAAALAVTAAGVVLAATGSAGAVGPAAVVSRYFAALERGDVATALSSGRRPAGGAGLLTAGVLRAQQRIAPITDVAVSGAARDGRRATVRVAYLLGYPDGSRAQRATVRLRRGTGGWRMQRVAGTTRLAVSPASQRATLLGRAVPNRMVALFPGAVPVQFDTPYLQVSSRSGTVRLAATSVTVVRPEVSRLGRLAVTAAVQQRLRKCLRSGGVACPLPARRVVPGSLRGRRIGPLTAVTIRVAHSPFGVVDVRATARLAARYERLTFRNVVVHARGRISLQLHTSGYVTAPLRLKWLPS